VLLLPSRGQRYLAGAGEAGKAGERRACSFTLATAYTVRWLVRLRRTAPGAFRSRSTRRPRPRNHSGCSCSGSAPLPWPPYITARLRRPGDYQTVYARHPGSSAAPTRRTAIFTPRLLRELRRRVAAVSAVTLHIGPATFPPDPVGRGRGAPDAPEQFTLSAETCDAVNHARRPEADAWPWAHRPLAVLESCVNDDGQLRPTAGENVAVHQARFHVPCDGRAADQLPICRSQPTCCSSPHRGAARTPSAPTSTPSPSATASSPSATQCFIV